MRRNISGQTISAVVLSASDGSAVTSGVSVTVTGDGGTQASGSGTVTHEGGGEWSYAPTQAETDNSHVMFKFSATGAIPVGVQIYPRSYDANGRMDVGEWLGNAVSVDTQNLPEVGVEAVDGNLAAAAKLRIYWALAIPATDTVASVSGTDITLTTGLAADDQPNGDLMVAFSGTGAPQSRSVIDYDHSTLTVTVDSAFSPQVDGTTQVLFVPAGRADVASWLGTAVPAPSVGGVPEVDVTHVAGTAEDIASSAELDNLFGTLVQDSVDDASATVTGFTVTTDVGTDVRVGMLRMTSGALDGESRLVSWTGTTVAVLSESSMPTALKEFSAAPADGVTFDFRPL